MSIKQYTVLMRNKAGFICYGYVSASDLDGSLTEALADFPLMEILAIGPHISTVGGSIGSLYEVASATRLYVGGGYQG